MLEYLKDWYTNLLTAPPVQRSMFDIQRSMFDIQRSMFDIQRSMFDIQRSMFDVQCSMFDVQCSMLDVQKFRVRVQMPGRKPRRAAPRDITTDALTIRPHRAPGEGEHG